jgi:hypothetical protein
MTSDARRTKHDVNAEARPNYGKADSNAGSNRQRLRLVLLSCLIVLLSTAPAKAQYKGDHIPGFVGLSSGSQQPPGIYVGNVVWVYPTDTVKNDKGDAISLPGSLTSTASIILASVVTNHKVLGGDVGVTAAFPFIKNEIQTESLDITSSFALSDSILGANLGWHFKRSDATVGYNLYLPTGYYGSPGNSDTGLGMWGNEFTVGGTAYLDQKRMWNASATYSMEFNTDKRGTNIRVGDLGTVEGGLGKTFYKKVSGPIPMITNLGVAGYAQFKITGDSGSDIPVPLRGFKDRIFALGPELNTFIPKPRLSLLVRYEPEFAARDRAQGQTILFSIAWVGASLMKHP